MNKLNAHRWSWPCEELLKNVDLMIRHSEIWLVNVQNHGRDKPDAFHLFMAQNFCILYQYWSCPKKIDENQSKWKFFFCSKNLAKKKKVKRGFLFFLTLSIGWQVFQFQFVTVNGNGPPINVCNDPNRQRERKNEKKKYSAQ